MEAYFMEYYRILKSLANTRTKAYKYGAATGFTVGTLIALATNEKRQPLGLARSKDVDDDSIRQGNFNVIIKGDHCNFAEHGDSGSLVMCMIDDVMSPLAVVCRVVKWDGDTCVSCAPILKCLTIMRENDPSHMFTFLGCESEDDGDAVTTLSGSSDVY